MPVNIICESCINLCPVGYFFVSIKSLLNDCQS